MFQKSKRHKAVWEEEQKVEFSYNFGGYLKTRMFVHVFHHWTVINHPEELKYNTHVLAIR